MKIKPALLSTSLWIAACGVGSGTDQGSAETDQKSTAVPLAGGLEALPAPVRSGLLPKWQTPEERAAEMKADGLDVRASFEAIYGITQPPAEAVRSLAEWEPADGVLIAWEGQLSEFFASLVRALNDTTTVYVITPDLDYTAALKDYLIDWGMEPSELRYFEYSHEAFWARDFGPITVEQANGQPAFVDMRYYYDRRRDDAIPTLLGAYFDVPTLRPPLASEGGNFMTNGAGLCAATSWLREENPYTTESELQQIMDQYFGCTETLILERIVGEGTGHIDMFAKFSGPGTVLVGAYDPNYDARNAAILDRNAARLGALEAPDGSPMQVVRIPMPSHDGDVFRSFTNSLIINGTVIIPTYDTDRHLEEAALEAYRRAFPRSTRFRTVDSSKIILYGGAVHCVTEAFTFSPLRSTEPTAPSPSAPVEEPRVQPDEVVTEGPSATWSLRPGTPIQDNQITSSDLEISADRQLAAGTVEVEVNISHSYVGDLSIALEHNGRQAILFRGDGPGVDLFRSFSSDAFSSESAAGRWTLRIADSAELDEGSLNSWTLRLATR